MSQKRIDYTIGFKFDESGTKDAQNALTRVTKTLKSVYNEADKKLKVQTDPRAQEELKKLQAEAIAVGNALQSSFNQKLNTFNITQFNAELQKAGFSIKNLGPTFMQAGESGKLAFMQVADAITQTQSIARKTTGIFDKLGLTLANTIRWSLSNSLINSITGSIQQAWGYTKKLDESLNNIRIVTGKSAEEMAKFSKEANKAARGLAASTTAYTDASLIYYQQGLDEADVEARTKVTIKAANVTGQSAAEVSEQLTAVWNGYKVVAEEAELYVDKLAAVAASTAADLEELSEGMSKVASAAATMGVDIDQLTAQIATIVSVTRQDASSVGTALKTIYARLGDLKVDGVDEFGTSLGDVSGQLQTMGVNVLDQQGNLRNMGEVITEVAEKWKTWTDAQQQAAAVAMAGKRQYNNLIALFENWETMYNPALETAQGAEGTLEKQQKTYEESMEAILQKYDTAKERLKGSLFDVDSMETVIDVLIGLTDALSWMVEGLGGLKNILPLALGFLTKLGPVNAFLSKGFYDIGMGVKSFATNLKNTFTIGSNYRELQDELTKLSGTYAVALQRRQELAKQHKNGLITDEEYAELKSYNEELIRSAKAEQAAIVERAAANDFANSSGQGEKTDYIGKTLEIANLQKQKGIDLETATTEELRKHNNAFDEMMSKIEKEQNLRREALKNLENEQAGYKKILDTKNKILETEKNIQEANQKYQKNQQDFEHLDVSETEKRAKEYGLSDKDLVTYGTLINKEKRTDEENTQLQGLAEKTHSETDIEILARYKAQQEELNNKIVEGTKNLVQLKETLAAQTKEWTNYTPKLGEAKNELEATKTALEKLKQSKNLTTDQQNQIQALEAECEELKAALEGVQGEETELNEKSMSNLLKIRNGVNSLDTEIQESGDNAKKAATDAAKGIDHVIEAQEKSNKALKEGNESYKDFQGMNLVSKYTGLASSAMMAYSAVSSLADAFAALGDENVSTSEKVSNFIMSSLSLIATLLPTVLGSINTIRVAHETAISAVSTKAQIEGAKAQMAFGWISIVITAIMAIAAIVISTISNTKKEVTELDKASKKVEEAKERAKEAQEELNKTRQEYSSLLETIKDYQDAKTALDGLRAGTDEWRKAVQELNLQVLDLVQQYPTLLEYLKSENGLLSISQEGFDKAIEDKQQEIKNKAVDASIANILVTSSKINENTKEAERVINSKMADWDEKHNPYTDNYKEDTHSVSTKIAYKTNYNYVGKFDDDDYLEEGVAEANTLKEAGFNNSSTSVSDSTKAGSAQGSLYQNTVIDIEGLSQLGKTSEEIQNWTEAIDSLEDDELKKALKELSSEITELDKEIHANSELLDKQTQVYIRNLGDKIGVADADTYANMSMSLKSLSQDQLTSLMGSAESQFKSNYLGGAKDGTNDDEKLYDDTVSAIKNVYGSDAVVTGLDNVDWGNVESIDSFKKIEFTVNGEAMRGEDLVQKYGEQYVEDYIINSNKELENQINDYAKKGIDTRAAYFMQGEHFKYSQDVADKANFTIADLQSLSNVITDEAVSTNIGDYISWFEGQRDLIIDSSAPLNGTEAGFANFTLDDFKTYQNNIYKAQAAGGGDAIAALYKKYSTDAKALALINNQMAAVNWNDTASIGTFITKLAEQGIIISENNSAWVEFMDDVYDGTKQWVNNSQQVIDNLATIKDLTGDIQIGDILSDEDYKRLLAISPEIASMFIKTADGYKALANSKELDKVLKKQYQGLSELKAFYGEVSSELELSGVKGSASLDFNKSGDVVDFMSTFAVSENIHNYDEIFDYAGTSKSAIAAAYEYVNTEGVDTTSSEYIEYLNLLKETANKINQAALDKENGLLNSRQGQEIWATEIAGSWSEVSAADLDEDIKAKAEKMWSDIYLTEMGFSGLTSFNLGASELEEHLETIRKLELDYYQDINSALDILGGKIERAFGADKIALLEEQSALYEENLSRANEQAAAAQNTFDSMFASFLSGAYEAYGVTGDDLMTEDGELDLVAMRNLQATLSSDSDEYKDIDNIISMWSSVEDAASTASEAAWSLIDAEVEAFRYQAELQAQLNETAKQWLEFGRKFEGYASGDSDVFGEQSAADMINDAFEDYAQERSALGNWFGQLDSLSGVMDNYNENIDEYNARAAETAIANASYLAAKQELINAQDNYSILKETLDTATSLKEDAGDAIEARDNAAANAAKQKAEMDAAQSDYDSKSAAYDSAIAARQSQDAELAAKQAALDSAQAAYDSALATKNAAQATADKASKKEKDAANAALNLANDGLTKAQAALTEAQNAQATAKTNQENALAAEEAARQAKADADATLKRETSEYNSTQEAANEATEKANEAIRQYAESLGVTYTEGMTVQDLEDELAALESSVSDAEAAVAVAQGEFQDAQEALTSAESAQRAVAERIAENNPYATVGEHGELIWNESAFNEDWETYLSEAQGSLEEMQGQLQNLYEGYLQAQEELMAIYDDEISKLSTINSILQSSADLWKIVGKNVSGFSSQLTSYYKSIADNTAQAYQLANVKLEIAQEEYEKVMALGEKASDEMIQTVTDNLAAASESVVSSASEWMTAIADEFSATMNAAIDDFMKQATGMDLASITESWELATQQDERYLDDVNAGYSIDNVERTFQKSIDATDSITAQKKLNSVMQEQLKMLREKDKLSQYDIDRANAMYELTLKQIALEEAQQTANKMKLSRDASGNYTYQYVADQDSIAKAEEELAAAENNLYNMDKERNQSLVDEYYATMSEANAAIAEAMAEGDTERVSRLKDYYFGENGLLSGIKTELASAESNLQEIGSSIMGASWVSSLESFTDAIVSSDLGSLSDSVGSVVSTSSAAFKEVTDTIEELLKQDSVLDKSLSLITTSLKSADDIAAETQELMVATHNVLTQLPVLTKEIDTLAANLESYGQKYQDWLNQQIDSSAAINKNTIALEVSTEATREMTKAIYLSMGEELPDYLKQDSET